MLPLYTKLFNNVLDTGIMPSSWLNGVIVPILENKGDSIKPLQLQTYNNT